MKALKAGKHVLLEKPSADTAEETREMFDYAQKQGLVLLEAFHYRSVIPGSLSERTVMFYVRLVDSIPLYTVSGRYLTAAN